MDGLLTNEILVLISAFEIQDFLRVTNPFMSMWNILQTHRENPRIPTLIDLGSTGILTKGHFTHEPRAVTMKL
jgi:hypothetical protein